MNIQQAKEEIIHTIHAYTAKDEAGNYRIPPLRQRPILLIGPPGVGKTAVVEQAAAECGIGLVAYTITHHTRQSAVGLPVISHKIWQGREYTVTEYTMSEIIGSVYETMEQTGCREGILFIDEINCVSETLMPTMLQLLQAKRFGEYRVPAGWVIVTAGNPREYNASVHEFDMVTLDRVKKITVEADYDAWLSYACGHDIHGSILFYLDGNRGNFYHISGSGENRQFLTARGWEDLSVVIREYEREDIPVTPGLIEQYLQCPEIAADYFGWYQLYGRCGEKLRLKESWEGRLNRKEREAQKEAVRLSGWEERLCVSRYFTEKLTGMLEESEREEALCRETERLWQRFLGQVSEMNGIPEQFRGWLRKENHALEIKSEQGLVDEGEERGTRQALYVLRALYLELAGRQEGTGEEWEARAAVWLQKRQNDHRERDRERQEKLSDTLRSLSDTLGTGTEFVSLLSAMAVNQDCVRFLIRHPCSVFAGYASLLQVDDRRRRLQQVFEKD
ncbi:MAG TPA: ATPase [Lachnospiraceae bacterium]|nr:ATPase [Lachnospiraceae bacterium]